MNTDTFLKTILPEHGVKYIMRLIPRPGNPLGDATVHEVLGDVEDVAARVLELDRKYPTHNIYFALATYKEAQYRTKEIPDKVNGGTKEFTYVVGRKQSNTHHVKSLWMDWDVGKDNPDSYATRDDALAGLKKYIKATGLPLPIIVSSGYGLHTYWVLSEEVTSAEWDKTASLQRVVMRHLGIKFDPSRDKDSSSVLRPPGTHNKKPGKPDQLVKVVRGEVTALPLQEYRRLLKKYVDENQLGAQIRTDAPAFAQGAGNLTGATVKPEYPDSYAEIAVKHCAQMQYYAETGCPTELWYINLGLLKSFKDGHKFAHEWSAKHSDYEYEKTQLKYEQWPYGPTTCDQFREKNAGVCQGCKMPCSTRPKGSPISLGQTEEVKKPNLLEIAAESEDTAVSVSHAIADSGAESLDDGVPLGWPERFGFNRSVDGGYIYKRVLSPAGVWEEVKIASTLFYPVEQIRDEDGTYVFRMHVWVRGKVREFLLPTKFTADPRSLKMQLHANQIHVIDEKSTADYLSNYMHRLQQMKTETDTYQQMGWKHDNEAFLIGDTLITATEERKVILSKSFPDELRTAFSVKGTKEAWIAAVDTLYNQPNGEPHMFAICAAFGSVLNPLLGYSEWNGIPYALTSDNSGYGKSTVNKIAMSIWMHQTRDTIVADSTPKAILGMASAYNNVPFLLDEVTSYLKDPVDQVDILYALSNGTPRKGMGKNGTVRQNRPGWCGSFAMTGNRNIMHQVASSNINPEAAQMRVFEIDLEAYPRLTAMDRNHPDYTQYNAEHGAITRSIVDECYGHIGVEYIRHVIKNRDAVTQRLLKLSEQMSKHMEGGDATKERYYYHLITCTLIGGKIAKELGFINFDLDHLRDWCVAHVKRLRGLVRDASLTAQDHFANMMSDLTHNIIVTMHYDSLDARAKKVESHVGLPLRNPICGRMVIGDEKERPQLYLTVQAMMRWCADQGVPYTALRRDFIKEGIIRFGLKEANKETGAVKVSLTRGVNGIPYLGKPWCVELDFERAAGILPIQDPAAVVELKQDGTNG